MVPWWASDVMVLRLNAGITANTVYRSVTQCRPENTHREFQPSNRNELLPKSPPFHAKVERVN